MTRQESAALNMAKFIRAQTLLLLERLEQMDLDEAAGCCEHLRSGRSALRHAERTDRRGKCVKIGEQVRNSVRGREAMAGCRGAALTRVFVMPARARYYKCTSCPGTDTGKQQKKPGGTPGIIKLD